MIVVVVIFACDSEILGDHLPRLIRWYDVRVSDAHHNLAYLRDGRRPLRCADVFLDESMAQIMAKLLPDKAEVLALKELREDSYYEV